MDHRHRVLVVDGANVVGSRPDGWWRDRPGAAMRLHAGIAAADLDADEVVLVLEGRATAGQPVGTVGRVRTVHASGHGDDEIVEQARTRVAGGAHVVVVTADRVLRERIREARRGRGAVLAARAAPRPGFSPVRAVSHPTMGGAIGKMCRTPAVGTRDPDPRGPSS